METNMNLEGPSYSCPMQADDEQQHCRVVGTSRMDAIAAAAAAAQASFPPSALDSANEPHVDAPAIPHFQRTQQRRKSCHNAYVPAKRRSSAKFARRSSATSVASISTAGSSSTATTTLGGCFAKPFPEKLMEMLTLTTSDPTLDSFSDSIEWLPHGKSFTIKDPEKFTRDVLPVYFKQSKFSSFTRKLYRWGFRQITKGPDANSYFHESFLRDDPESASNLKCNYSPKELQVQAENSAAAARRRASAGVLPAAVAAPPSPVAAQQQRAARRGSTLGLPSRRGSAQAILPRRGSAQAIRRASVQMLASQSSINEDEDDEAAVMAQIEWAAAAMAPTEQPPSPSAQRAMRRASTLGVPSLRSSLISSRRSSLLGHSSTRSSMSSMGSYNNHNHGGNCYGGGNREVPNSITLGDADPAMGQSTMSLNLETLGLGGATAAAANELSQGASQFLSAGSMAQSAMSLGLDDLGLGGPAPIAVNELSQGSSQGLSTSSIRLHNGQVPGPSASCVTASSAQDTSNLSMQQLLFKQRELEDAILAREESEIRRRRQRLAEERHQLGRMTGDMTTGDWCSADLAATAASVGMGGGMAPPRHPVGPGGDGQTHLMGLGNGLTGPPPQRNVPAHNSPTLQGMSMPQQVKYPQQAKYPQVQGQLALARYNQALSHSSNGFNTAA